MESNQIFNYSHCSDSPMNRIKKNRVFPTHEAESLVGTGSEEESNSVPGWRGRNLQRKNSIEQPSSIKEQNRLLVGSQIISLYVGILSKFISLNICLI